MALHRTQHVRFFSARAGRSDGGDTRRAFCGSLSGGCVEENFLQRIAAGEYRQPSQIVHYGEGGLTPDIALPCGGSLDVLVEYLPATAGNAGYLQRMGMALAGHYALSKSITPPAACDHLAPAEYYHATQIMRDGNCITLHLAAPQGY